MQDEPWYREIAAELRHYKKYKARIGVLEARMIRQTGPANKVLASYGGINAGRLLRRRQMRRSWSSLKLR